MVITRYTRLPGLYWQHLTLPDLSSPARQQPEVLVIRI
jgi:hypothetical protein